MEFGLQFIWSIFVMYLIVRYLNHTKYKKDMEEILEDAVERELYAKVEPFVVRKFEAQVKNYLLESKVVDKTVQFRWSELGDRE